MPAKRTRKPTITFAAALDGYWLARRSGFSPHTVSDYQLTFARFAAYIGDTPLADITAADVQRFLDQVRDKHKLGKKSVNNIWIALSSFWTWATVELHVEHIIRGHVRQPDYRPPAIETYTEVEIKAMLAACQETKPWRTRNGHQARTQRPEHLRDQAIIITLIDTGLRASELCNLELRDYQPQHGRLLVRGGKGDKDRLIFIGQSARRLLWRYLVTRPAAKPTDPIFPTNTNQPIERNNLRKTLQRIGARAGVTGITVHRFRHTFAVNFLRNGGNVLELQELLGHEKMETVRIYAKLAAVDLAAAQRRASVADNWRL
jgi:integrase/recombinase XerD